MRYKQIVYLHFKAALEIARTFLEKTHGLKFKFLF